MTAKTKAVTIIQPDGTTTEHEVSAKNWFKEVRELIGARVIQEVQLGGQGSLWVDEEGLLVNDPQFNPRASRVANLRNPFYRDYSRAELYGTVALIKTKRWKD